MLMHMRAGLQRLAGTQARFTEELETTKEKLASTDEVFAKLDEKIADFTERISYLVVRSVQEFLLKPAHCFHLEVQPLKMLAISETRSRVRCGLGVTCTSMASPPAACFIPT